MLETPQDILNEYERRPRALSREFLSKLAWDQVKAHPLDPKFLPILTYMRDVERLTEVYFEELRRTPTGKEPAIQKFMERWNEEEAQHGELLNRFLAEAGYPDQTDWYERAKARIPRRYRIATRINTALTNLFGRYFSPTHMVWGAINELTTLQGYRRLSELAAHPVLTQLLRGIMQEESVHVFFYFNVARLGLRRSAFARGLARQVIRRFWGPVGSGIKSTEETQALVLGLFGDAEGQQDLRQHVEARLEQLPGLAGVNPVTQKINELFQMVASGLWVPSH
ncbi:MAG: acyl-ACP desaturase [bacterium]